MKPKPDAKQRKPNGVDQDCPGNDDGKLQQAAHGVARFGVVMVEARPYNLRERRIVNAQQIGIAALAAAFLVGVVWLNLWYRAHRAKLTPEERKRQDEEWEEQRDLW